MLPFTTEQLFEVFAGYNSAIWPLQLFAYAAGFAMLLLVLSRKANAQRAAFLVLAALWLWTGQVYFVMHFSQINPAADIFGFIFMLAGGAFILFGLGNEWPAARTKSRLRVAVGIFLALYALILYPYIGAQQGHVFPAAPSFGLTPCPLTIFTFALLIIVPVKPYRWLYIAPILWAVVGGSAALMLGVTADLALPLSALASIVVAGLPYRPRQTKQTNLVAHPQN